MLLPVNGTWNVVWNAIGLVGSPRIPIFNQSRTSISCGPQDADKVRVDTSQSNGSQTCVTVGSGEKLNDKVTIYFEVPNPNPQGPAIMGSGTIRNKGTGKA